ncbi:GtrA family protein [bacterium]|nr:GtrA family protein [bacterium]
MLAKIKAKISENTAIQRFIAVFSSIISKIFHYIHKKLFWGLFSRIDEKFFKFLFVGALNTLFAYSIYALFVAIGLQANVALFLQYIVGVLWNFKTTGAIVFKNHDNSLIFKFVASYIFTFLVNSVLLKLLTYVINDYLAQAILVLPIAMLSFIIFKLFVFKDKSKQ